MQIRRSGGARPTQKSHDGPISGTPRGVALALLCALLVAGCKTVQLEVYRKPHHHFTGYGRIAVLPFSPAGKGAAAKENAREVTALLCARLVKEHYDIMDADAAAGPLREAGLQVNGASDETALSKAADVLGVKAILTGELLFYGPFDYHVPPSRVPYSYMEGPYDYYGGFYYGRRGYYYEPGYTETGSRARMKLKLFDADLGTYVWWADGDRNGSERIPQRYAEMVIKKALEKFPVRPRKH